MVRTLDNHDGVDGADPLDMRREDAFADNQHWLDTGCYVSPSCLSCPLPQCIHDVPGGMKTILLNSRNDEIIFLHERGHTAESISEKIGISRRSIFRVLRKRRPDSNESGHCLPG